MASFTVIDLHLLYLISLGEIMIHGKLKINYFHSGMASLSSLIWRTHG